MPPAAAGGAVGGQDGAIDAGGHLEPGRRPAHFGFQQRANYNESVSADGRIVAYESTSTNIVSGQATVAVKNVFLYNRETGTNALVSHTLASFMTTADDSSVAPVISGDGQFVLFSSKATDLVQGRVTNGYLNVYLYNMATGSVELVSHKDQEPLHGGTGVSEAQGISRDGRFVVYLTQSPDLFPGQTDYGNSECVYDTMTHSSTYINHTNAGVSQTYRYEARSEAAISDNGNFVVYTDAANNNLAQVYLYNVVNGGSTLISQATGSPATGANGDSATPLVNDDGSVVAFTSTATNLVAGANYSQQPKPEVTDSDGMKVSAPLENVFLFTNGVTTLVSHATGQPLTAVGGYTPVLSGDGNAIAFKSQSANLVTEQSGGYGAIAAQDVAAGAFPSNIFLFNAASLSMSLVSGLAGSATQAAGSVPTPTRANPSGTETTVDPLMSISHDGGVVAYTSQTGDAVNGQSASPNGEAFDSVFEFAGAGSTLVSGVNGSPTTTGDGTSLAPAVSRDGGVLAIESFSDDLNGTISVENGNDNVWVYDLANRATGPLLASHSDLPSNSGAVSIVTSVSGDGNFSVFQSTATNLIDGQVDNNISTDVFFFDKTAHATTLLSHTAKPSVPVPLGTTAGGASGDAVISADGNFIAFDSTAPDLVVGQFSPLSPSSFSGYTENVFLYNRQSQQMLQVSHRSGQNLQGGSGDSFSPAVSADGHYVAFISNADDLVTGSAARGTNSPVFHVYRYDAATGLVSQIDHGGAVNGRTPVSISNDGSVVYEFNPTGESRQVYLYDQQTGTNQLVSHLSGAPTTPADAGTNGLGSFAPVISADGQSVAFYSNAMDLAAGQSGGSTALYLYSVVTGTVTLTATIQGGTPTNRPAINDDGNYVAYITGGNVAEYSRATGTSLLVSHDAASPGTGASGMSDSPVIDADGSLVAYRSTATDLVPEQSGPPGVANIFVWDRLTTNNVLASGSNGSYTVGGNANSFPPVISKHSFPYFSSNATDLAPGTFGQTNAFVNTIVKATVTLGAVTVPVGAAAGTVVGSFNVTIVQGPPGQLRLPTFTVDPGSANAGNFTVTAATTSTPGALLLQVAVNRAVGGTYQLVVDVDLGYGDPLTDKVVLTVAAAAGSSGGRGIGAYDSASGMWYLRNEDGPGDTDAGRFVYGLPNWVGVVGDWDGNGTTTVGVVDPSTGTWYLRNENSAGATDYAPFKYGLPGWIPVVGDWDHTGHTGIGMFDPSTGMWYLKDTAGAGAPSITPFAYGLPGWTPVAGDWSASGHTGVGVIDPSSMTWYLRNAAAGNGGPDFTPFSYGAVGWKPVVGDWDGNGTDSVGVFDPSLAEWYLRFENSAGGPEVTPFSYGLGSWQPVSGRWTGTSPMSAGPLAAEVASSLNGVSTTSSTGAAPANSAVPGGSAQANRTFRSDAPGSPLGSRSRGMMWHVL